MNKLAGLCAGLVVLVSGGGAMVAQDTSTEVLGPPKVLVIDREFTRPGKDGAAHVKTESAFVNALTAAKWPDHYLAMTSMSGKPRALFLFGYPSFEAWEKSNHDMAKNEALSALLDKANVADGELLDGITSSVFTYDPDNSLRAGSVVHSRYFEISQYHVKPGHRREWMELVKMYHDTFEKSVPDANWALYDSYYGEDNGGLYLVISKMTSLKEDDASMGDDKKFADAMGPEGMKKVEQLTEACLESQQTNLFEFSPKMSYVDDDWVKADPYWKAKSPAAAKKPAPPANP